MAKQCRFDSSVSCPFWFCHANSIFECNVKSGRFTLRVSKVVPDFRLWYWRLLR